eukprot:648524-Amphidinium_carterae.1
MSLSTKKRKQEIQGVRDELHVTDHVLIDILRMPKHLKRGAYKLRTPSTKITATSRFTRHAEKLFLVGLW